MVLVVYSVATLRSGKIIQFALYKTSLMKISPSYAFLTEPYMYFAMNLENFVRSVEKMQEHTFGLFTFDWLFALLQIKYPLREYFGIAEIPDQIGGYNTFTIFWSFYRDFGILGISCIPFLGGLYVGSIYYKVRMNPTVKSLSYYSIMVFVMAMSFFTNLLGFLWFIYIVAWIVIVLKLIAVKNLNNNVLP
jgi:oligosaccharide repeat unit polymerase